MKLKIIQFYLVLYRLEYMTEYKTFMALSLITLCSIVTRMIESFIYISKTYNCSECPKGLRKGKLSVT